MCVPLQVWLWQRNVNVDESGRSYVQHPSIRRDSFKDATSERNISEGISWEGVHIPSQWSELLCCLRLEGAPERGVTDHWDTMPRRGPASRKTHPSISPHTPPIMFALHYPDDMRNRLCLCARKDRWQWITHTHIHTFKHWCTHPQS